jgi:hypothetical protein
VAEEDEGGLAKWLTLPGRLLLGVAVVGGVGLVAL